MIPPQQKYCFGEIYFQPENKNHNLDRKISSIDIITQKQIFCRLRISTRFSVQDANEIIKLPMYISHNGDWILELHNIWFVFYHREQNYLKSIQLCPVIPLITLFQGCLSVQERFLRLSNQFRPLQRAAFAGQTFDMGQGIPQPPYFLKDPSAMPCLESLRRKYNTNFNLTPEISPPVQPIKFIIEIRANSHNQFEIMDEQNPLDKYDDIKNNIYRKLFLINKLHQSNKKLKSTHSQHQTALIQQQKKLINGYSQCSPSELNQKQSQWVSEQQVVKGLATETKQIAHQCLQTLDQYLLELRRWSVEVEGIQFECGREEGSVEGSFQFQFSTKRKKKEEEGEASLRLKHKKY